MKQEQRILIDLIRCALGDRKIPGEYENLSVEERRKVILYAKKQELLPFLQYFDLFSKGECREFFFRNLMPWIYWETRLEEEWKVLENAFEEEGINYIPLKGIRTKEYYPSPELRTMGDLDILYQPRQTEKLKKAMRRLGYEYEGDTAKHDHYKREGCIVEMHKELLPVGSVAYEYYQTIWERAEAVQGKPHMFQMSLEDHYIFTFCHLLEHFIRGGIGIRMVLDIYILSRASGIDLEYIANELESLGIGRFEKKIRELADLWFSGNEEAGQKGEIPEEILSREYRELEEYIICGGVYGNKKHEEENQMLVCQSGVRYLWKRAFPSYKLMKSMFPWLQTPVLLPAAWICRYWNVWTRRRQNIQRQWKAAQKMERSGQAGVEKREQLFEKWGLDKEKVWRGY